MDKYAKHISHFVDEVLEGIKVGKAMMDELTEDNPRSITGGIYRGRQRRKMRGRSAN